jgi:hypothetical protein
MPKRKSREPAPARKKRSRQSAAHTFTDPLARARERWRQLFLHLADQIEPYLLPSLCGIEPNDEKTLTAWAEYWHLTDSWCLDAALAALKSWHEYPVDWDPGAKVEEWKPRRIEWKFSPAAGESIPFGVALDIDPDPLRLWYDPTHYSRQDFKAAVLEETARIVDAHCDRVDALMRQKGLRRAPSKRDFRHFWWLARFQVKGESFESIAGDSRSADKADATEALTADAVEVAVRRTARFIGLTLRRLPKAGRPAGRVELHDRVPRQRK